MVKFIKTKTEHHILPEFHTLIREIEKHSLINRIIPGRISRQQKGSSEMRFKVSYPTASGIKCIISKGATAQELFIVCNDKDTEVITEYLNTLKY
ncbi:MAG: DUF2103 domain-containing protein [Candidatus Absconditabacterales bacterium]